MRWIAVFVTTVFATVQVFAQAVPKLDPDTVVERAAEKRNEYLEVFRNLVSQETKTSEIFDKKGRVKRVKNIRSIFIVYPLSRAKGRAVEFRNVIAVNDQPIENADKRAQSFFEKITAAATSKAELDRIERESQRFDPGLLLSGFTLFQAVPLQKSLRPNFEFALKDLEIVGDRKAYVIEYRQSRPSPSILANRRREPENSEFVVFYESGLDTKDDLNARLSGKLWIDPETFQIFGERRAMHIQPPGFPEPVLLAETSFEYAPSDYGILTPRKVIHTQYEILREDKISRKEETLTFSYGKFTRPEVEVKEQVESHK